MSAALAFGTLYTASARHASAPSDRIDENRLATGPRCRVVTVWLACAVRGAHTWARRNDGPRLSATSVTKPVLETSEIRHNELSIASWRRGVDCSGTDVGVRFDAVMKFAEMGT